MFSSILKKHNVLDEPHGYPFQLIGVLYLYNVLGGARTMEGAVEAEDEATLGRGWHATRARGFPSCI